jgi:hypothetical protein
VTQRSAIFIFFILLLPQMFAPMAAEKSAGQTADLADRVYSDIAKFLVDRNISARQAHAAANQIYTIVTNLVSTNGITSKLQDQIYDQSVGALISNNIARATVSQTTERLLTLLSNQAPSEIQIRLPTNAMAIVAQREFQGSEVKTNISVEGPAKDLVSQEKINQLTARPPSNQFASSNRFDGFVHFGAITLNPFTISQDSSNTYHLNRSNSDTLAYLELFASRRWGWRNPLPENPNFPVDDWVRSWDFSTRAMYVFQNSGQPSGSTIIGSGDLSGDLLIAKHLFRLADEQSAFSINLALAAGVTTDTESLDIHDRYFAGPEFVYATAGFPGVPDGKRFLIATRFGYIRYEVPTLLGKNSDVVLSEFTFPDYHAVNGFGMEIDAVYPVTHSLALATGLRFYQNGDPNPWSVFVGVTYDLSALAKGFTDSKKQ